MPRHRAEVSARSHEEGGAHGAVEGPLASVRGAPPEDATYSGAAELLLRVWIAVRTNLRKVAEHVTVADIAGGHLPPAIDKLAEEPDSWVTR